jgi:hypothetical protein
MEPGGSSSHSQEPATCPYLGPDHLFHTPHPTSRISILILPSHQRLVIQVVSVLQVFPPKPCLHLSSIRPTSPITLLLLLLLLFSARQFLTYTCLFL